MLVFAFCNAFYVRWGLDPKVLADFMYTIKRKKSLKAAFI